ncbi:hypothetical protein M409DRAFT_36307 [Zasmidium cellare ATCC 36951]|uniref:Translation initiation factor eIF2B subunit gamma n=1 Tax=Zasmidium cellare ATCC 36951 TaxID=1080233 RepID=A0A6A6CQ74_ZASCE|nr:uncharacterized protein M409DRAFT_36307 [Zasmidium cellare ATCC 36951]KAF2168833.1 hypothetical protein M409DRAFT_36307 [Zasmidium cellare ATCC 36951]
MPHATVPSPGLQAFILCGPGASLSIFASNPNEFSKALIPIANRPMVWYPLDWCYRTGINADITLITPPESKSALEAALATNPYLTSLPNPKPEILAPQALTQTSGTGELLRSAEVQKAITSDFVILPCDLVSELPGTSILQQWMSLNPLSISSKGSKRKGGLSVFYPTHGLEGISQKKEETDFIATTPMSSAPVPSPPGSLRPQIETVVMSMPTDTVNDKIEEDKGFFRIRTRLTRKYGRVKMRTKHRDAHVYILPKWVKEYAIKNEKFDSISEDVVGWWAKAQWQEGLGEKLGLDAVLDQTTNTEDDMTDSAHLDDDDETTDASLLSSTKVFRPTQSPMSTTFASRVGNAALQPAKTPLHVPPLLAYVQSSPTTSTPTVDHPLVRRVDTSASLLAISLYLAKQQPGSSTLSHEHKLHPSAKVGPQSRVSQEDSLVGENVTLGSRTIVKESVIGSNCEIGNNVRLTRCLLMDGVVVGHGVQLTGCTVGRRARIEGLKAADRTRLTDCEVAPHFVVEAGTEAKGEQLMAFGGDMDDMDEDDEDDDGAD